MPEQTQNYDLIKQLPAEFYNRELDNQNLDVIDALIKALQDSKANGTDLTSLSNKVTQHLDDDVRHVTQAFKDGVNSGIASAYNLAGEVQVELRAFKAALTEGFTANQFSDGLTTLNAFNVTEGYYNQPLSRLEV